MTRAAVLTVSDSVSTGERDDTSGDLIAARLLTLPADVVQRVVVADDVDAIRDAVESAAAHDLVVITGGTGLGPRDVTPQALDGIADYDVTGMAEAMRAAGMRSTPLAMLSRQRVCVMGSALVLALPGSPRAVGESLDAVWEALPHALQLLAGERPH